MEQHIISDYQSRVKTAAEQANKYKELLNTYSLYRLGIFGLSILSVCIGVSLDDFTIIMLSLFTLSLCFAWIISKQSQFEVLKNYFQNVRTVNENEIGSITARTNIYHNGGCFVNDKHNYASDLDIFGDGSLFQLINRAATFPGIVKLAKWLNSPESKEVILLRQQAVSEIGSKNDWRIDIQAHLVFSIKQHKDQIKNLLEYLKIPIELEDQKWLIPYIKIAPYLLFSLIILAVFISPLRYFAGVLALANVRIVLSRARTVNTTDLIAGKIGESLKTFVSAFKRIEIEEWESPYLMTQAERIKHTGTEAISVRAEELSGLINKLNYRLNVVASFILNTFFLWEIRMVIAIENWKRSNQHSLEEAFDVIAEYEALISLSSLRINYPDWCFPQINGGESYTISAKQIAHPLIGIGNRIANDYELTDTFKIDIITGSNMAGKSTFLRTIGINTVLALCGAPVCAYSMQVSVVTVLSYMRIKDSLNESTSTFKAELDRLQMLLAAVDSDAKVFFLIDEMLRGTNSVDKYLGSKAVIQQLISKKGVGMVATHDLQIAELEKQYPDYIRNFYFDIQLRDGEMLFDYKIKHGECKTFNASLLLKRIGINVEA